MLTTRCTGIHAHCTIQFINNIFKASAHGFLSAPVLFFVHFCNRKKRAFNTFYFDEVYNKIYACHRCMCPARDTLRFSRVAVC